MQNPIDFDKCMVKFIGYIKNVDTSGKSWYKDNSSSSECYIDLQIYTVSDAAHLTTIVFIYVSVVKIDTIYRIQNLNLPLKNIKKTL